MFLAFPETNGRPRRLLRGRPGTQKRGRIIKRKICQRKKTAERKRLTSIAVCGAADPGGSVGSRLGDESEPTLDFGLPDRRQGRGVLGEAREIPVVEQPNAARARKKHRPLIVLERFGGYERPAAVVHQPFPLVANDQGGVRERDVHPLGPVLKIPAPLLVGLVVAPDEVS